MPNDVLLRAPTRRQDVTSNDVGDLISLHAVVHARAEIRDTGPCRLSLDPLETVVGEAHRRDRARIPMRGRDAANDGGCKPVLQVFERDLVRGAVRDLAIVPALGHSSPSS